MKLYAIGPVTGVEDDNRPAFEHAREDLRNCGHGDRNSTVYCEVRNYDALVSCEACSDWIEQTDTLEQRHQQLEQVARKMWFRLKDSADSCNAVADSVVERYLDQLTELGVNVDD